MIINVGLVPFDWGTLDLILLPKWRGPWLRLRISLKSQFFNLKKKSSLLFYCQQETHAHKRNIHAICTRLKAMTMYA